MGGDECLKCGDATTTAPTAAHAATLSARHTFNAMDSSECAEATASHAVVVPLDVDVDIGRARRPCHTRHDEKNDERGMREE